MDPLPVRAKRDSAVAHAYSGVDNLEAMESAVNYNTFIIQMIVRAAAGRRQLVDFGAGIGTFAKQLRDLGYRITCVERDLGLAQRLRVDGLQCVRGLDEVRSDVVECIYCVNVLEHIGQDDKTLAQFAESLSAGGRLFVYVPAFSILFTSMDKKVGHLRRYTRASLVAKLRTAGFNVKSSRYVDCLGFFATLWFRAFGNRRGDVDPHWLAVYDRWLFPVSMQLDHCFRHVFGKNLAVVADRL